MSGPEDRWDRPARRPGWLPVVVVTLIVGGGAVLAGWGDLTAQDDPNGLQVERDDTGAGADRPSAELTAPVDPLRDGLAHNQVWSMAVGHDGTVWAGTDRGLSRFDGDTWVTDRRSEGPGGDAVSSVAVGRDGHVWAGTQGAGGVSRLDDDGWTRYTEGNGLAKYVTGVVTGDDGTAWATSLEGLWRFDGRTWEAVAAEGELSRQSIRRVVGAGGGSVWVVTYDGLWRFDGRSWRGYTAEDGLPSHQIGVGSVVVAGDGTVWAGTREGLSRLDGGEWTTYTTEDGLVDDAVTSVAVAGDGTVWAGTREGLSRFDGGEWTSYTTGDGLVDDAVTSVAVAGDGTVWVGTSDGVSRLADGEWASHTAGGGFAGAS